MRHLFRLFKWVDTRYTPQSGNRYKEQWTLGQDDMGNAIPYDSVYFH